MADEEDCDDSSGDGHIRIAHEGTEARIANTAKADVKYDDFAEEFPTELAPMTMSSAPAGPPQHASLQLSSALKVNDYDDRYLAHGSVSCTKRLEHAPPSEPMRPPGLQVVDSMESSPLVSASNQDVATAAFPVQSFLNGETSRTFRSPPRSTDSTRQSTTEDSKQDDGAPNPTGADTGSHGSTRVAAESDLYIVDAQLAPEKGTIRVANAEYVVTKWYQRPLYRRIFACGVVGAVAVLVVGLVVRPTSAASTSSTMLPTPAPTALTPEIIACNFLSLSNVTKCRSTFIFSSDSQADSTTSSTIPSEIGLLTQLTSLSFYNNSLASTIPSEIGLLTRLTELSFYDNALTSTIPSEIGLLTQLMKLDFGGNFFERGPHDGIRLRGGWHAHG